MQINMSYAIIKNMDASVFLYSSTLLMFDYESLSLIAIRAIQKYVVMIC
jgi:hypothetical protein